MVVKDLDMENMVVIQYDSVDFRCNVFDIPDYQLLEKYGYEHEPFWDKNTCIVINKMMKFEIKNMQIIGMLSSAVISYRSKVM